MRQAVGLLLVAGLVACTPATARAPRPDATVTPHAASTARTAGAAPGNPRAFRAPVVAFPQTTASPVATTAMFSRGMKVLWDAVLTNRADEARAVFFPLQAYQRLKAVGDPTADWRDRLFADFTGDVAAAHQLVSREGLPAHLLRVVVASSTANWVPPGRCYNRIGYWHVAESRLVYSSGAGVRSFGIASMISWRGTWYVVHLGAVLRSSGRGIVDQPTTGPGVAGKLGGC